MHVFWRNAIRVALLYSGFISNDIQTFYTLHRKPAVYLSSARVALFLFCFVLFFVVVFFVVVLVLVFCFFYFVFVLFLFFVVVFFFALFFVFCFFCLFFFYFFFFFCKLREFGSPIIRLKGFIKHDSVVINSYTCFLIDKIVPMRNQL